MASMSGMNAKMLRRKRVPGGLGSPRGSAFSASETFVCSATAVSCAAQVIHVRHWPNRSIAGATMLALATPTSASAARSTARSTSPKLRSIRPIARRL